MTFLGELVDIRVDDVWLQVTHMREINLHFLCRLVNLRIFLSEMLMLEKVQQIS